MDVLNEFIVKRNFSYSKALRWVCKNCGREGNSVHFELGTLIDSYEKHVRIIHRLEPEESPF